MNKTKLFWGLRVVISLALLGLLLYLARENFAKIGELLSSINIPIFILAYLAFLVGIILMSLRLKLILAAQAVFVRLKDSFCLTLIGYFFNNFMPTSIGGDLIKGHFISKKNNRKLVAYTSVLVDRIIGMSSVALIASLALVIMRHSIEHKFILWAVALLLTGCALFMLFIFQKRFMQKISKAAGVARLFKVFRLDSLAREIYQALTIYAAQKKLILRTFLISLTMQFISFSAIFLLAQSLSAPLAFAQVMLVVPVIYVLTMLPVTMNGLGLREWSFVLFFSAKIGSAGALSLSLLYLAMFLSTSLIGGIIYLFWR